MARVLHLHERGHVYIDNHGYRAICPCHYLQLNCAVLAYTPLLMHLCIRFRIFSDLVKTNTNRSVSVRET